MPKVSDCTYAKCADGLTASERENFTATEEAHWRACHDDEPLRFTCPYTGANVEVRRNPQDRYLFTCMCRKSRLLNTGSVKRHYALCSIVKERVTRPGTSHFSSEPLADSGSTSKGKGVVREKSPALSLASEIVPYQECKLIYFIALSVTLKTKTKKRY